MNLFSYMILVNLFLIWKHVCDENSCVIEKTEEIDKKLLGKEHEANYKRFKVYFKDVFQSIIRDSFDNIVEKYKNVEIISVFDFYILCMILKELKLHVYIPKIIRSVYENTSNTVPDCVEMHTQLLLIYNGQIEGDTTLNENIGRLITSALIEGYFRKVPVIHMASKELVKQKILFNTDFPTSNFTNYEKVLAKQLKKKNKHCRLDLDDENLALDDKEEESCMLHNIETKITNEFLHEKNENHEGFEPVEFYMLNGSLDLENPTKEFVQFIRSIQIYEEDNEDFYKAKQNYLFFDQLFVYYRYHIMGQFLFTNIAYWLNFIGQIEYWTEDFKVKDASGNLQLDAGNHLFAWELLYAIVFWFSIPQLVLESLQLYKLKMNYFDVTNICDSLSCLSMLSVCVLSFYQQEFVRAYDYTEENDPNYFTSNGYKDINDLTKIVWSLSIIFSSFKFFRNLIVLESMRKLATALFVIIVDMIPYLFQISFFVLSFANLFYAMNFFDTHPIYNECKLDGSVENPYCQKRTFWWYITYSIDYFYGNWEMAAPLISEYIFFYPYHLLYSFLMGLSMINTLIAITSKSYEKVDDDWHLYNTISKLEMSVEAMDSILLKMDIKEIFLGIFAMKKEFQQKKYFYLATSKDCYPKPDTEHDIIQKQNSVINITDKVDKLVEKLKQDHRSIENTAFSMANDLKDKNFEINEFIGGTDQFFNEINSKFSKIDGQLQQK